MPEPECHRFDDDGRIPNSPLPLLVMRAALPPDPAAVERAFAGHDWTGAWRGGIYPFQHFHSTAHEVLGVARGCARVRFGGRAGTTVELRPGDVVVIPAGVGHCSENASDDFLVVGAYPGGAAWDVRRGEPAERDEVLRNIAAVPLPDTDPVGGRDGPLRRLWRAAAPAASRMVRIGSGT